MKFISVLMLLFVSVLCFNCDVNFHNTNIDCTSDLSVTQLDAPQTVNVNEDISVNCVIKNVIENDGCTISNNSRATVTYAYSPIFRASFDEYEITQVYTDDMENYSAGEGQEDLMHMSTSRGRGYYAMKVEVASNNDENHSNNAKAVAVEVK